MTRRRVCAMPFTLTHRGRRGGGCPRSEGHEAADGQGLRTTSLSFLLRSQLKKPWLPGLLLLSSGHEEQGGEWCGIGRGKRSIWWWGAGRMCRGTCLASQSKRVIFHHLPARIALKTTAAMFKRKSSGFRDMGRTSGRVPCSP